MQIRAWLPHRLSLIIPALLTITLLGGCLSTAYRYVESLNADPLSDTAWRLVEFQSMDDAQGTLRPRQAAIYRMQFNADGGVEMQLDCNHATGTWSIVPARDGNSGQLRFGPLAVTKARCRQPSLDTQITSQAPYIRGYLLKGDKLYLTLMADGGVYALEPDILHASPGVPAAPEAGGPRNWKVVVGSSRLNVRAEMSTRAKVLGAWPSGTVLDNLGCARSGERVWCDVQVFGGGTRGFVAAEYLEPVQGSDGRVISGPDDSALRAGNGDFDARGDLPCVPAADRPATRCTFGVARAGGGDATLVIRRPHLPSRAIFVRRGIPMGADTSEADGYPPFSADKQGDLHTIHLGGERYEFRDAMIFGG